MEVLQQYLNTIRVPSKLDNVYKDECVYSFDNPETNTGLYISLSTFLSFGQDFVELYSKESGNPVFLHIYREKTIIESNEITSDCQPEPKITRLALGVEGGFQTNEDKTKYKYTDHYSIVVFPGKLSFDYPNNNLPIIIQQSVEAIIKSESANDKIEKNQLTGTWDGEIRKNSKVALDLKQIDNNKLIPPSGWQCEKCELKSNLWLNLTDGSILCGRKNFDGSGGNDHAIQHFRETGYPLAVKLGTISSDNKADVFSYVEDDMVIDPKLSEHLSHFGIKIHLMEKSEKSMIELELDINKRIGEWCTLTESDSQLIPISGPGYTGMINRGNYCYMNSVMQVLFTIPDFIDKYVNNAHHYFQKFPKDPINDFNIQMSKLGSGLWSGKYSKVSENSMESEGISPNMFKNMIGRNHPDFSTQHQQDALDFFLHLANTIKKNVRKPEKNPMDALKFTIEDRVRCTSSGKVKYTKREEYCLSLSLPMENDVSGDNMRDISCESNEGDKNVRPRISFETIIENFSRTEIIDHYYSTAIKGITKAEKYSRFATLPEFLLIQFKKFTMRSDWTPIKLDVAIDNVEKLDLSHLKSLGKQHNEELLPDKDLFSPEINQTIVNSLVAMGFPLEASKKAVFFTKNSNVEEATEWIMQHITDSDINDPLELPGLIDQSKVNSFVPDPESLAILMSMGFDIKQATKALRETNNNIERATDWIFSHPEDTGEIDCNNHLLDADTDCEIDFKDGSSKYKLVAFISHMGSSSHAGHYVCHIFKEDKWVIYNDNKVAISQNPPKDLGYLYMYKRYP